MSREHLPNRRQNETQEFERDGIRLRMSVGFKSDGSVGEIFLNADRADSTLDLILSDVAIAVSIALQHGVPLKQLVHGIKRDRFGLACSVVGAALDRLSPPEPVRGDDA